MQSGRMFPMDQRKRAQRVGIMTSPMVLMLEDDGDLGEIRVVFCQRTHAHKFASAKRPTHSCILDGQVQLFGKYYVYIATSTLFSENENN